MIKINYMIRLLLNKISFLHFLLLEAFMFFLEVVTQGDARGVRAIALLFWAMETLL